MLDDSFKLYAKSCLDLVNSIVLKSEMDALLINNHLRSWGETVDENAPETWKYYLNLAGQYYVPNSPYADIAAREDYPIGDTVMVINAAEDGTEIPFTTTELANRSLTKATFNTYKAELFAKYPLQEELAYRIVNPIDINKAIAAEDFEILSYDASLVGDNEMSLMRNIQNWIYRYKDRWLKRDFQISDPLYMHAFYSTMRHRLVSAVINMRWEKCGTPEVADFHLWNFLADHYELDQYRESLSRRQALWLYRNMVDIQRNAGKEWVLSELITNLATPKGLVAEKFDFVRSDSEDMVNGRGSGEFLQRNYFEDEIDVINQPVVNHEYLNYKTRNKADKNRDELEFDNVQLEEKALYEVHTNVPTGVLEFNVIDQAMVDLFSDVKEKIEYWLYLSATGRYDQLFTFEIPNSGTVTLSAKDAFLLYEYARKARSGVFLETIEPIVAWRVVSYDPNLTLSYVRSFIDSPLVTDDFIEEALADRIPPTVVTGPESLDAYVDFIRERKIKHRLQVDGFNRSKHRAVARWITQGIYENYTCTLEAPGTRFNDWLSDKRIRKLSLSSADWNSLMLDILFQVTGIDPNNIGIGLSKQAMIEIIDRLTSYSLIVVDGAGTGETNEFPFEPLLPDRTESSLVREVFTPVDEIRFQDQELELCSKEMEVFTDIDEISFASKEPVSEYIGELDIEFVFGDSGRPPQYIHMGDIGLESRD